MLLDRDQVITTLTLAGVYRPTWFVADSTYTTLDAGWVTDEAWPGWIASLPLQLIEVRTIGGGKTLRVPRWLPETFDCDDHTADFCTYVRRCCAVYAVQNGLQRGGTPLGSLSYTAAGTNNRTGAHDTCWFINHSGEVRWFEPAEGTLFTPTPSEVLSVFGGECR